MGHMKHIENIITNPGGFYFYLPQLEDASTTLNLPISACYYSEVCSAITSYSSIQFLLMKVK